MEPVGLENTTYNLVEFIDYGQVGYGVFKLGIQNDLGVFWIHLWYVKSTFENNYWNFEENTKQRWMVPFIKIFSFLLGYFWLREIFRDP